MGLAKRERELTRTGRGCLGSAPATSSFRRFCKTAIVPREARGYDGRLQEGKPMTRTERFLFSTGLGWELARLLAVFTPTAACLVGVWWMVSR
jgi:hypothetical protein